MKKLILPAAIFAIAAFASSAMAGERPLKFEKLAFNGGKGGDGPRGLEVWTDPETGCQYLSSWTGVALVFGGAGAGGLTPRLNVDGTPMCSDVKKPD